MSYIVETCELTRLFGDVIGVKDLNLSVEEAEIYGFLGPNGAGKTTTIRLLMNFLRSHTGEIRIFQREIRWGDFFYHGDIGFLPGEFVLPANFSGETLLKLWSNLGDGKAPAREKCLKILSFSPQDLKRKTREYSSGMRQKLALVGAMQSQPRLLIMDEPTSGLDPLVKHSLQELLKDFQASGCTIFFSSHILSEVEQIADTAGIIRQGKLVTQSSISDLKHRHHKKVSIIFSNQEGLELFLQRYKCPYKRDNLRLSFLIQEQPHLLLQALQNLQISDLTISELTLEDIFLHFYEAEN
jgi:ABC-2 type transport system ATP-binding protein